MNWDPLPWTKVQGYYKKCLRHKSVQLQYLRYELVLLRKPILNLRYSKFALFEFALFEFALFEFALFEFALFEFALFEFALFEFALTALLFRFLEVHRQKGSTCQQPGYRSPPKRSVDNLIRKNMNVRWHSYFGPFFMLVNNRFSQFNQLVGDRKPICISGSRL